MAASAGQTSAAVFTVTQSTDDGSGNTSGSLSWAIQSATADGDIIQIAPAISSITVTGGTLPGLQANVTIAAEQAVEITGASLSNTNASSLELSGASLSQAVTTGLSGGIAAAPGGTGSSAAGQIGGNGQNGGTPLLVRGFVVTSTANLTGGDGGRGGVGADSSSSNVSFAGGTGGTGGAALDVSYSKITNKGTLTAGSGGVGGDGGGNTSDNKDGGSGGNGGTGGVGVSGSHFTLSNDGAISGGSGGLNGAGGDGQSIDGDSFGAYGSGGMGGAGVSGTDISLINSGTIAGGNGYEGSATQLSFNANTYYVSNGGAGGAGIVSAGSTITNSGTIAGGSGGAAGIASTGMIIPLAGGAAGTGGIGVSGSGTTIVNSGTISGGSGGASVIPYSGTIAGPAGAGSAGISGSNLTVVNSGTVSGGLSGDGKSRANAIEFTSGTNSLELQAGLVFNGNVVANGSQDTLIFGGSTSSNFDLSSIGAQYSGFEAYSKSGTSTWIVTGVLPNGTSLQDLSVSAGTLDFFGDGTSALAAGLTVDGGTLRISNGATLTSANGSESVIGNASGSNGTVVIAGSGSIWNIGSGSNSSLTVGGQGAGALTVSDGGTLSTGGGSGFISVGPMGTLNIGAAAGETALAPGVLDTSSISLSGNTSSIVFNHTDMDYQFDHSIDESGTLAFYSGVTTLTGNYNGFTPQGLGGFYEDGDGVAEIYKTGALNLTSNFPGAVGLNDGVLFEANTDYENYFLVRSGGTLSGSGSANGLTVFSGGTLAPGDPVGTLTVKTVGFNTGSIFQAAVNASGGSGKLISENFIEIDSGVTLSVLAADETDGGSAYNPSTSYSIIEAQAAVVGRFDKVEDSFAFLDASVAYSESDVTLTLNRATTPDNSLLAFSDLASTPNQKSVADTVEGTGSGTLHDAVQSMRGGETEQGFQALSGESHATMQGSLISGANTGRSVLTRRIVTSTGGVGASSGDQVSMGFHGKGEVPVLGQINAEMWGEAFGGWGKVDATSKTASSESYGGGFLTGFDAEIIEGWRTGVMAGYSRNQFRSSANRSSGSADSYHIGAYAGTQMDAMALRFGAAYTWHDLATRRDVAFTGFTDHLEADYTASTAQAFAEIGYAFDLAPAAFEPFAGIAVINQHTDGFTETGGAAALTSGSSNDVMGVTTLGLRGEVEIARLNGISASLTGSLAWRHAFGDVEPSSTMRFASGGNAFAVTGTPIDGDTALFEAGLSLEKDKTLGLNLTYQGELGASAQTHSGRLSLLYRF
ncbi:autotransporter domain-containing protein [Roseibium litorale]|uniref:autotransporter domain-containing protein n=1 Tax=Roseibium litorale TaxID=2803841 RepID=UPI00177F62FE|nr:autotransporter domain-containing protein [Roseibium litorale]